MRRLARLAAVLVMTTTSSVAAFEPPGPFTAVYDLRKGPLTLARADVEFDRLDDARYRYRMHTRAVGVTRLFYSGEIREESIGEIRAGGFRPERYRYRRRGDDRARTAELRFDWPAGEVVNDIADYPWRLEIPPGTIDRVISPMQLMHDLAERGENQQTLTYRIADGGELKHYTARIMGKEIVDTPAGRFRALKVVRRAEDGERRTTLWCVPELNYFTVRIEQWDEDDGTFNLVLARAEGLDLAQARLAADSERAGQ